jgi:transcription elongation factor Elf1
MYSEHYRQAYFELQCSHCKKTTLIERAWIYFATELEKTYKCPFCNKVTKSTWIEVGRCDAENRIMKRQKKYNQYAKQ